MVLSLSALSCSARVEKFVMEWRCKEHQLAQRILTTLPMLITRFEPLSGYQLPPTRPDGNGISRMFSTTSSR